MSGLKKNKSIMKSSNSPPAKNKEKIDFLFPKEGQEVTVDDFKKMVKGSGKRTVSNSRRI